MSEYVELAAKRNRGWPWPEESYGLTPMYGEGGWCRACGTPQVPQSGPLVLQPRNLSPVGAFVPYWQYVICLEQSLAEHVRAYSVELREVEWPRGAADHSVMQIVVPTVGERWFDPDELRERTIAAHGTDGRECQECRTWRWMPIGFSPVRILGKERLALPPLRVTPSLDWVDIAASPEWFGDGWNSFRHILVRRELAELIASASPRDFEIVEPA